MLSTYSKNRIVEGWGDWLQGWDWEWWCTFTFRDSVMSHQAHKLWLYWLHSLESTVQSKVHYVRATEKQRFRGDVVHFHCLVLGVKDESPKFWQQEWVHMAGLADVKTYDPNLGAAYYLAKHAADSSGDIIMSGKIEKLRRIKNGEGIDFQNGKC